MNGPFAGYIFFLPRVLPVKLTAPHRFGGLCLAALLALCCIGTAWADRGGNDDSERFRSPGHQQNRDQPGRLRSEGYPASQARRGIAPNGLRHRDYPDQPVRSLDARGSGERGYSERGPARGPEREQRHQTAPSGRPVNDVIRQVERNYGGKVVGVQQEGANYRVRVLQRDGRVKTVMMPAQ